MMPVPALAVGFNDIVKAVESDPKLLDELVIVVQGMALGMSAANLKVTTMGRAPIWCITDSQNTRVSKEAKAMFDRMVELHANKYVKENTHLSIIMLEAFNTHYPCK